MSKKLLQIFFFLFLTVSAAAQNSVRFQTRNEKSGDPVPSVSVTVKGDLNSTASSDSGNVFLRLPAGRYQISFSSVGYQSYLLELTVSRDTSIIIYLQTVPQEMEEVIISSTRTDSRIENTPTRVEVLGAEEVDEESGVKPSNIVSLLGDVAGIQSQQTSAVTMNTELRIQGLPGDYTQVLRDGMPLFGGYAGGFTVLQIPPLDIKQIEIIKGASSTLYGGGAIAGMINIISKKPRLGEQDRYLLLNQSTLRETNMNVFLSDRDKKRGYTFLAGGSYQKAMDVNRDDFSDLPLTETVILHPNFFIYPNDKNTFSFGLGSTFEERKGGDMEVLKNFRDNNHQFFILNRSYRNTLDGSWEHMVKKNDKLTVKGIASWYYRNITTNTFGLKAKQVSWFSEISYVAHRIKHDLVGGLNVNGETFRKRLPDSSFLSNYQYLTVGLFVQDDWRIHPKWTIESGIRTDFHNDFGAFVLPRVSVLYKISPFVTSRIGGGVGYKVPTLFSNEIDERDYRFVKFAANSELKAERSSGVNCDINFKKKLNKVWLTINQSFFVTRINHPLVADTSGGSTVFKTASAPLVTKGLETWVMITYNGLEAYLGYTFADARRQYDPVNPYIELSARNKFASVISYEFSSKFRACIEASYTGKQYLQDGSQTPSYPFVAAMVRYDISHFSFVLNCENLFDYRQTRKESIVLPPLTNPRFKQIWAPIDGRAINLSVRVKF